MNITAPAVAMMLAASVTGTVHAAEAKSPAGKPFGDWVLQCAPADDKACGLRQKVISQDTKLPVAAFVLTRNKEGRDLRLTAILPLGLDIPPGVSGKLGDATLNFAVQTCLKRGCIATTAVNGGLLETMRGKDGFTITFHMRSVADAVTLPVSLKGLDEGLKALDAK